ncbi:GntR family transcriptional regulator [Caballeronia catudaia]|nr:GntR family transcriptional regulator [Caballeronia catudaia]
MNSVSLPAQADLRLPRYQLIRDDIVRRIAEGQWAPGQAIPTESDLCTAYEVSIGTLRKAIDLLVAEGVLTRTQGKGTFVRRPRFDSSLFRFFRFKSADGDPVQPTGKILDRKVLKPSEAIRAALQMKASETSIRLSRVRLIDSEPVLREEIWLPRHRFGALVTLPLDEFGDLMYPLYERACRQIVASAKETLTVEEATSEDAAALRVNVGSPIIVVQRVALDFAGTPIEWRTTRGAATGFQYQVDIR